MPVSEISLTGGLNSDDSLIDVQPGQCLQLHNYEVNILGKYSRLPGFERFDGQPAPSEENYYAVSVEQADLFDVGDVVTVDETFNVTVVGVDEDANIVGVVNIPEGSAISSGQDFGATTTTSQGLFRGHPDYDTDKAWQLYAEGLRRTAITAVPGGGSIRGVFMFQGVVYAFRDNAAENPTHCACYKSTAAGWVEVDTVHDIDGTPDTIAPGGRFEFRVNRFPTTSGDLLMLCTNGVDKAMWFDGNDFWKIDDFFEDVYPTHLEVLPSKILMLGYPNGSVMYSALNDCSDFQVSSGGAEISFGEPILGILTQPNESHVIFQEDRIHVIYGTNPADFRKTVLSNNAGAYEWSIQDILEPMFVNDKGIMLLSRVQQFGDFQQASVTQRVETLMDAQRKLVSCAYTVREKNQYRVCYTDGTGVIATFDNGQVVGFSTFEVGAARAIETVSSCKDETGAERIFFGGADGFVYEGEKGNSHDGDAYTSVCRPAFNYVEQPERRKRFKKLMIEVRTEGRSSIQLAPELGYDGTETPAHSVTDATFIGPGGYWGEGIWGRFVWSAPTVLQVDFYLHAVARNISPTIFCTSDFENPHTLRSMLLEFEFRGKRR